MAQYGDQHGRRTDEYVNPVRKTDEYGDPVHRPTGVDYGTTGAGGTYGTTGAHQTDPSGTTGTQQLGPQVTSPHVTSATIGAIRAEPYAATGAHPTGDQGTTGGPQGGHHEKKGMMEKIKEKLPGHQHNKST